LERWAAICGIVFVALMFGGTFFVSDFPDPDASQQKMVNYLTDSSNQTRNIVGAYVWVLGAIAFLVFVTRLRTYLRRADGGTSVLPNVVFGAGVIYSVLMMVSAITFGTLAYAIHWKDAPVTNTDLVRVLPQMAWAVLLLGAGFAGIVVVIASCVVGARTGALPRWLLWLGGVMAVLLLFDAAYQNIVPFLVWVLAAAIVLLMRRDDEVAVTGYELEAVLTTQARDSSRRLAT
jgi:hypothetical protein